MKLLLDTHLVLWSMRDDAALSNSAKDWIEQAEKVYVIRIGDTCLGLYSLQRFHS